MLTDLMTVGFAGTNPAMTDSKGMLMAVVTSAGILVVFAILLLLIFIFYAYGGIFQIITTSAEKKKAAKAKKAQEAAKASVVEPVAEAPVSDISDGEIPGEIIAVIAAAVASLDGGKNLVVKKVRRAPAGGRSAWAASGILENTRPF